jgi:hypothetical protein
MESLQGDARLLRRTERVPEARNVAIGVDDRAAGQRERQEGSLRAVAHVFQGAQSLLRSWLSGAAARPVQLWHWAVDVARAVQGRGRAAMEEQRRWLVSLTLIPSQCACPLMW